jgi:hypothetical protein
MTDVLDSNFIVDIKTAIIRALRASFDDLNYPDDEIQGINISMDYPMEENSYPHLWVQLSFTKLQNAGIGHVIWDKHQLKREWYFEATVRLNIVALSSKSRDIYSSQLIQMLAFGDLNPVAFKFDEALKSNPNIHLTLNRDSVVLAGQQTTIGTPWSDDIPAYEDGFSLNLIGQVESTFTSTPAILKKITVVAEGFAGDNSMGVQTGEWI